VTGASAARTLYVLRHGERVDDVNPRWGESAARVHDPPLTPAGVRQARATGRLLREAPVAARVDAVLASPFVRAAATAHHVARVLGTSVRVEPGLSEHLNPEWFDARPAVLPVDDLAERLPTVRPDRTGLVEPTFPESWPACAARTAEAARRLLDAREGTLLLVGHGATVGGVVDGLAGPDVDAPAPYCGLTRLSGGPDGWRVVDAGRTAY
jgi:broad specificity phosphatase PhoE